MARRIDAPPDLARPDSELALFGYWRVEPGNETRVTDPTARTRTAREPNTYGLITHSLFPRDGDRLPVTQLTRVDTRPDLDTEAPFTADVTSRVPGIEVLGVMAALSHRSTERRADASRPGRYTHATVTLADPSPGTRYHVAFALVPEKADEP